MTSEERTKTFREKNQMIEYDQDDDRIPLQSSDNTFNLTPIFACYLFVPLLSLSSMKRVKRERDCLRGHCMRSMREQRERKKNNCCCRDTIICLKSSINNSKCFCLIKSLLYNNLNYISLCHLINKPVRTYLFLVIFIIIVIIICSLSTTH